MARNLLKNPNGDEDMEYWELTENGGNEWRVEEMPGDCGHAFTDEATTKFFTTSFELCLKKQLIDLLAEGYSCVELDYQPAIHVEDWYCSRTDCGCVYQLRVCLLDENKEVIQEFTPESVTIDPYTDDCSWRQITHTFSEYGPGVRFISFEHGGRDTKRWKGWFGVRVTGSSVTIGLSSYCASSGCRVIYRFPKMARNLLKNPNGDECMQYWELTENGGDEWRVEEMPGDCGHAFTDEATTKFFTTSFELCLKKQLIDLLAEGYSSEELDYQPAIHVEDWYCSRTDCGCVYQLRVCLLDENKEVIQEFTPESVTIDPYTDDCSWRQITHTFSEYGPGVRFISFEHGGRDTKRWKGWFGVRVTGSSVTIDL